MFLWAIISGLAVAQDCRPPEWALNEVRQHVENFAAADALAAIDDAAVSYACSEPADPTILAELWLARGMAKVYAGDMEDATLSFTAASRLEPDHWIDTYGSRELYDEAAALELAEGTLTVHPSPGRHFWIALDGQPIEVPHSTANGLHLLQIGQVDLPASFARFVEVPVSDELIVRAELTYVAPEGDRPLEQLRPTIILGSTAGALFLGAVGARLSYNNQADDWATGSEEPQRLRLAWSINALHWGSMITGGVAAVLGVRALRSDTNSEGDAQDDAP